MYDNTLWKLANKKWDFVISSICFSFTLASTQSTKEGMVQYILVY